MANNVAGLRAELLSLLSGTTNLDAITKTKLRNSFVTAYPGQFAEFLVENGLTDTAANRGQFAINRTFNFWRDTVRSESIKANIAAVPAPDDIS